jgi:hypothetical protein
VGATAPRGGGRSAQGAGLSSEIVQFKYAGVRLARGGPRCTPQDFLVLVERQGIAWHERKHRQLFCDHSSKQILQLLEDGPLILRLLEER